MSVDPFAVQTPEQARQAAIEESWHREQARKANDTIRVANPSSIIIFGKPFNFPASERRQQNPEVFASNGDYFVKWEQGRHRVPIDGELDIVRYIARTYCADMFVEIINYYGKVMGEQLLKRVGKEKPDVLLDKYLENKAVWDKVPHTDDERLMAEVWPQLWLGVVKEWGLDNPDIQDPRSGEVDLRTPQERVMESLENKRVSDAYSTEETVLAPISSPVVPESKEKLLKEVSE